MSAAIDLALAGRHGGVRGGAIRRTGPALVALSWIVAAVLGAQDAGRVTAGAESYHDSLPGESVNGVALDFRQLLPIGGVASAEAVFVDRQDRSAVGRATLRFRDVPVGSLRFAVEGGDLVQTLDASPFHFADDFPPAAYLRGGAIRAESPAGIVTIFEGRNERFLGIRLPTVVFAPESVSGATLAIHTGEAVTFDADALRSSSHDSVVNPLFGSEIPLNAESYGMGATVRLKEFWTAQARASYARYDYAPSSSFSSGHFLSFVAGSVLDTSRWKAQVDYVRQGVNYVPLSTASAGNREGPHVLLQSLTPRWTATAAFSSYRNNLEENPALPDLRSRSAFLSANWRITRNLSSNWSISEQDLSSRRGGETSRFTQRTAGADVSVPTLGYTRVRYQYQTTDEPTLRQRLQEVEIEQQPPVFRGIQLVAATRFQHDAGGASSLLYRGSVTATIHEVHLAVQGEWGRDLAASTIFSLNRSQTITATLSMPLPAATELRLEGYWNRISAVVNPESIFASQITQEQLFSVNRRAVLVRLVRSFGWGREPSRPGGTAGAGPLPYGEIHGVIFQDGNGNAMRDPGEPPVAGIVVVLDDGQRAISDAGGRFMFHNVIEGIHTVRLDLDVLPVAYNPPRETGARISVMRLAPARYDFGLIATGRISGRVEQELASGERLPSPGAIVTLLPTEFSTYADEQGSFSFSNLPPGIYRVRLEEASLPEGAVVLAMRASEDVAVEGGDERTLEPFVFSLKIEERPVQKIFEHEQAIPGSKPPGHGARPSASRQR